MADLIGGAIAFLVTLTVLSYIFLKDWALFRWVMHIFIGAAAGYAGAVALRSILLPMLLTPLLVQHSWVTLIPLTLALLMLLKIFPGKTGRLGNISVAFLVGTGAAAAVGLVLPELAGKFDGLAVRVPVINVSLVDLTFTAGRDTTKEEINAIVEKAAANSPVLAVNAQPLVSIDFNHDAHSSTFDANHTRVNGRLVKIMAWYDNEWGFSNRMLDTAIAMQKTAK